MTPAQLEEMALSSKGCAADIEAHVRSGNKNPRSCMLEVCDYEDDGLMTAYRRRFRSFLCFLACVSDLALQPPVCDHASVTFPLQRSVSSLALFARSELVHTISNSNVVVSKEFTANARRGRAIAERRRPFQVRLAQRSDMLSAIAY